MKPGKGWRWLMHRLTSHGWMLDEDNTAGGIRFRLYRCDCGAAHMQTAWTVKP